MKFLEGLRQILGRQRPKPFVPGMTLRAGESASIPLEAVVGPEIAAAVRRGEGFITVRRGPTYRIEPDGSKTLIDKGEAE